MYRNTTGTSAGKSIRTRAAIMVLPVLLFLSGTAAAQEEVASAIRRYKERELSTGYYEAYEVKPLPRYPLTGVPGGARRPFTYSPTAARVRIRSRLADSHQGIKFYENLKCDYCHVQETKDIHTVRAGLTCRQCHGGEPIASIDHYYSLMNPIRRHAYVCSKCHEGAGASFASYIVHEPDPTMMATLKTFPPLFIIFWAMAAMAGGTFLIFLPHAVAWGIRELLTKRREDRT